MRELDVNLMPVVDSQKEFITGFLTLERFTFQTTRFYTTKLNTEIGLEKLHNNIEHQNDEA